MLPLRVRVRGPRRLGMVATGSSPMARGRGRGTRTGWLPVGCWAMGADRSGPYSPHCKVYQVIDDVRFGTIGS